MIQINSIYHDIQLSFGTSDVKRTTIKQNSEDTHVLRIKLYDKQNNEITIDSNWNINISAIKGDKTHILNTNNISIKDNTIHVTMTKQMLSASGTEHCELIIQDRDQTLFSDTFLIYVEPNVQDGSFIESSNECDSIIDTLQHVEEKKDMVDQLTSEIEETKVDIGKTYDELKIAVKETNDLIQENQIIKSNEAERQNNEGIRQSQEADRQTNTATAIANAEEATKKANDAADDLQAKLDSHHFVLTEDKGSANGVAELDGNGIIISSQLPSYVDDVIEGYFYNSKFYKESTHTTEITGEAGKIYIDLSTEKTYRWSGSAFVVISETLALGETSSTAYRGDRGKIAYEHSQSAHAPSNAEENQNAFSSVIVGDDVISAISKTDVLNLVAGDNITLTPNADTNEITISSAHPSITKSTDSTSTASPSAGGTFTAVDSVTRDGNGHVTKVNTKTITLPNTSVIVDSALSSTSTNPVQNKVVYDALKGKSGTGHTHTKSDVGLSNVDNTADAEKSVKYAESAGSATNSKFLDGFIMQTDTGWGVQTGEYVHGEETNDGCTFKFNKNCPSSGKLSMIIDGNFYQNEGNYMCLDTNNYSSYALPLSGGTVTGSLKVNGRLNIGDKVTFWSDNEGGNIRWYSPAGVQWEFDCFDENFRLFNYNSFKDFRITRDKGDVYLPNNLYLGASAPKINLNGMYFYRDGNSNQSTHIYGNSSSYPHLWLRQFSNVFQFFPNTTYASGTKEVHIGHSAYRFGDGYFTNVYNSSGVITTSDRNKKHDIEEISDDFSEKIVDGLIPSSFKFNDGSSGRTHFGIIAQDLEKLLEALGISTTDFAPLVKEYPDKEVEIENPDYDENDENSQKYIKKLEKDYDAEPIYNVRYEEFIMILVKYCQVLKKKDLELEQRMSELEEKVNTLIAG